MCERSLLFNYMVYLRYWTLNLMPLMVYPTVLVQGCLC